MLVLSRKRNESIIINNDIVVTVVEIRGDKVRLGIEAPTEVPVHRREVYDKIQRRAAGPSIDTPNRPAETGGGVGGAAGTVSPLVEKAGDQEGQIGGSQG